jgi:predicted unusual protein kinase regulating ubiquinone biosynthesis (AarF/ABC1/UbiB family)
VHEVEWVWWWQTLRQPQYVDAMRGCFDDAPSSSWSEVATTLRAELGRPLEEVFDEFERTPIASASLAQVHRARLRGGAGAGQQTQLLAVKVQHPGCAASPLVILSCRAHTPPHVVLLPRRSWMGW